MRRAVSRKQVDICDIMAAYDVSFSIGNGLLPGSIDRATSAEQRKLPSLPKAALGLRHLFAG